MREEFKNIELRINEGEKRFEIEIEGSFAFIEYKETSDLIALIHAETESALAGKGAGTAIVEKTLNYMKTQDKKILPLCPFIFAFIKKHLDYKHLVDKSFDGYDKL